MCARHDDLCLRTITSCNPHSLPVNVQAAWKCFYCGICPQLTDEQHEDQKCECAQGRPTSKWQSRDLNPGLSDSRERASNHKAMLPTPLGDGVWCQSTLKRRSAFPLQGSLQSLCSCCAASSPPSSARNLQFPPTTPNRGAHICLPRTKIPLPPRRCSVPL